MKEPLQFSRLRTVAGVPVATAISDFRQKMDSYDAAKPPAHHADHRRLLLIGPEKAEELAALACGELLMAHNWDGKKKYRLPGAVTLMGNTYAVIMGVRQRPTSIPTERPVLELMLADLLGADDWQDWRFTRPEQRFDPQTIAALGSNYYSVGPVFFGASKNPRPYALGYTTRAIAVDGLETSDVWPILLPERAA